MRKALIRGTTGPDCGLTEPFLFQRAREAIDQPVQSLGQTAGLDLAEVLHFLQTQQRAADFGDALQQRHMLLRPPRSRCSMRVRTSSPCRSRSPPNRYFMATGWTTTLPPATRLARFLRRPARDKRDVQQGVQAVVGAGTPPFGKQHQGPVGRLQNLDGGVDRLAIDAFAVDAEGSDPRQDPGHDWDFG